MISLGTIFPAEMLELIISASLDPDFLRSARRRSPAERWAHPWFLERRVHCVPLPAPVVCGKVVYMSIPSRERR